MQLEFMGMYFGIGIGIGIGIALIAFIWLCIRGIRNRIERELEFRH